MTGGDGRRGGAMGDEQHADEVGKAVKFMILLTNDQINNE